ncbi:MAG: thioredoxin family protein [Bacteroidota bacterium]
MLLRTGCFFVVLLYLCAPSHAQVEKTVQWLTFEQLEDSLAQQAKPVFIDFYTDWCTYCRKMDKVVFTKPQVVKTLNTDYYAVRFDAETEQEVTFGGRQFVNDQIRVSRQPVHQIAQLLALRDGGFTPPTMVVLDKEFNVAARYFEYMDSKKLLRALSAL